LGSWLLKKSIFNKVLKYRRGQLNIAEVVVSASIILVLTVSIAQLGSEITVSNENESLSSIRDKADQILRLGLELGVLRNLTYTDPSDTDYSRMQDQMITLIDSQLPPTVEYSLYRTNRTISGDNNAPFRVLLGLNPVPSSGTLISSSIFVSGVVNTAIVDNSYYVVTLLIAVGGIT
jgi:hypothetical protein